MNGLRQMQDVPFNVGPRMVTCFTGLVTTPLATTIVTAAAAVFFPPSARGPCLSYLMKVTRLPSSLSPVSHTLTARQAIQERFNTMRQKPDFFALVPTFALLPARPRAPLILLGLVFHRSRAAAVRSTSRPIAPVLLSLWPLFPGSHR